MNVENYVFLEFQSRPENISFARSCVAAFAAQIDCTLDDIEEIKLVVSEAVSNSLIHGYENQTDKKVSIAVFIIGNNTIEIIIKDEGKGIGNIKEALEPAFSTDPSRLGLGFAFMKSFMDDMEVTSKLGEGTSVRLRRNFMARDKEALA